MEHKNEITNAEGRVRLDQLMEDLGYSLQEVTDDELIPAIALVNKEGEIKVRIL